MGTSQEQPCAITSKDNTLAGGRQCSEPTNLLLRIFYKSRSLLWDTTFQKALCLYIPVLLSPGTLSLLTQALRNHWKAGAGLLTELCSVPHQLYLCSLTPPWRTAFIGRHMRKQRALQLSSWLLDFITSKLFNILLICVCVQLSLGSPKQFSAL